MDQQLTIALKDISVHLTPTEYPLVHRMMRAEGRAVPMKELNRSIGYPNETGSDILRINIHRIRHKIGADSISSVIGFGYGLVAVEENTQLILSMGPDGVSSIS